MVIRNGSTYPKVIGVIFTDAYNHGSQKSKQTGFNLIIVVLKNVKSNFDVSAILKI
jgi:hypothetical protein